MLKSEVENWSYVGELVNMWIILLLCKWVILFWKLYV